MKKNKLSIVLLGSGNLAYHLGKTFSTLPGYPLIQWYARSVAEARTIAHKFHCKTAHVLSEIEPHANLYILCISDDQIESLAGQLVNYINPESLVLHTSGSKPSTILGEYFSNNGVLYPLQTFSKSRKISFNTIPIHITASNTSSLEWIAYTAKQLSKLVIQTNDADRLKLHMAAVLVNNFPNYIYDLVAEFLTQHHLEFKSLYPLIEETLAKIKSLPSFTAQTGPAKRGDLEVIQQHLEILRKEKKQDLFQVYELFSRLINNHYQPQNQNSHFEM